MKNKFKYLNNINFPSDLRKLKKSELRLDDILENVSNTIVIWDGDKKLSKINSAGRDIWKKVFGVEDRV